MNLLFVILICGDAVHQMCLDTDFVQNHATRVNWTALRRLQCLSICQKVNTENDDDDVDAKQESITFITT